MNLAHILTVLIMTTAMFSCTKDNSPIEPGNDPNFTIIKNEDGVLNRFSRKVVVFGINVYAVPKVTDDKLLHAANLMAQYLDNDEDGNVDNQLVVDEMIAKNAFLIMWKKQSDLFLIPPSGWEGQDLGNDETHPSFVSSGKIGSFDAALEEVLHLITHVGYAGVYPDVFGEKIGTDIANAMDIARGGQFTSIPSQYPENAWYTYDDSTCDYSCMATEYVYWSLTSILGAQENRLNDIEQEWELNTKEKVEMTDQDIYKILTNSTYHLPTILPDGTYRH